MIVDDHEVGPARAPDLQGDYCTALSTVTNLSPIRPKLFWLRKGWTRTSRFVL
jgi:hypothetical protein